MTRTYASKATDEELLSALQFVGQEKRDFCGIDNCARAHYRANLCRAHYQQAWVIRKERKLNRVRPDYSYLRQYVQDAVGYYLSAKHSHCHVPGCSLPYQGRGFCKKHYLQWYKFEKENSNVETC